MKIATAPRLNLTHDGHTWIAGVDYYRIGEITFGGAAATSRSSSRNAVDRLFALLAREHGAPVDLAIDARLPSPY